MECEEIEARHNAIEILSAKALACTSEDEAMRLLEAIKLIRDAGESSAIDVIHWHVIARLRELSSENAAMLRTEGVYAIHFENGIVKIGRTKNYQQRRSMLSQQSFSSVVEDMFFPCDFSASVEALTHRHFKSERVKNEFFRADYGSVVRFIEMATRISDKTPNFKD